MVNIGVFLLQYNGDSGVPSFQMIREINDIKNYLRQ